MSDTRTKAQLLYSIEAQRQHLADLLQKLDKAEENTRRERVRAEKAEKAEKALENCVSGIRRAVAEATAAYNVICRMKYLKTEENQFGDMIAEVNENEFTEEMRAVKYLYDVVKSIMIY